MNKPITMKDPYAEREAEKYEHPIPSREFILDYLAERGKPATLEQLQTELDLTGEQEAEALRRRLIAMVRDGQLLKNRKGAYGPLAKMELLTGRVIGHKDGFGFVVPELGGDDLFLSPRQMRQVFHGDRVIVRVAQIDNRGRREALIAEVVEHNTRQIVGRLFIEEGVAYVEPANQRINQAILIPPEGLKDAQHGQMVVAAITTQPSPHARPMGEIIEVLGDHMAPGMEINVAIRNHNLPYQWPEEVIQQAESFPPTVQAEECANRTDYRQLAFVTIDGDDAKDFDDAVHCISRPNGGYILYVAIADVSYYVAPKTPLDQEAYQRGNSVYFPGRVIPMLPETLSNNLCSLKQGVDRLCMVCEMIIHPTGRITRYQFREGVIHSHARLTYNQVHAMMEKGDPKLHQQFQQLIPHLENLYALFRILHKARTQRGAIDFDLPETKIVFGKNRKIEKIIPYERFTSHRVIEECMLAANICAAKYLAKNKQPALYRVHEGPSEEKLTDLRRFLNEIGIKIPLHRDPVPADYAHILRVIADRPDAHMIQMVLLRSMSQAVYSPDNKGHFGLAYEAYTHFTSPIRRYPDLIVHRALKHILNKETPKVAEGFYERIGEHTSMTERRADDATNEAKDWLKCEFMMDKVGQEFAGRISGATSFGIFVELADIYVEGLVHISNLPDDYYQFDAIKHALIGDRSGRRFRLGDKVTVRVARVDLDQQEIDFILAETFNNNQGSKGGKRSKRAKKMKAARSDDKANHQGQKKKAGKKKKRKR